MFARKQIIAHFFKDIYDDRSKVLGVIAVIKKLFDEEKENMKCTIDILKEKVLNQSAFSLYIF